MQEKVRTGAITLKKVWGEVNPADLFTKHLPSREKVHQLLGLFNCEYRTGRAAAAPLLRPHSVDGRQGGQPADDNAYLPTYTATRADQPHDASRLPHRYPDIEIDELFPTIEAAAPPDNCDDWIVDDSSVQYDVMNFSRQGRRRERGGDRRKQSV